MHPYICHNAAISKLPAKRERINRLYQKRKPLIATSQPRGLDAKFEPVTELNKSSFRFFRVDVELP